MWQIHEGHKDLAHAINQAALSHLAWADSFLYAGPASQTPTSHLGQQALGVNHPLIWFFLVGKNR